MTPLEAERDAVALAERCLRDGVVTEGQELVAVSVRGDPLATVWFETFGPPAERRLHVVDVDWERGVDEAALAALGAALDRRAAEVGASAVQFTTTPGEPLPPGEGWRRVATRMILRLDRTATTDSEDVVRLEAMSDAEFEAFFAALVVEYAEDMARAGAVAPSEALDVSRRQTASLLPEGCSTPSHSLLTARHADEVVGSLWLFENRDDVTAHAFVYDIVVAEGHRGRGFGRGVMRAAEDLLRQRGNQFVELNVFGFNDVARHLYLSLGYEVEEERVERTR